jgi:hypothetical protein
MDGFGSAKSTPFADDYWLELVMVTVCQYYATFAQPLIEICFSFHCGCLAN